MRINTGAHSRKGKKQSYHRINAGTVLLLFLTTAPSALAEPLEPRHLLREVGNLRATNCEAVWGDGNHAYIECASEILIVDISNPEAPLQVASWPGVRPIVHNGVMFTCGNDDIDEIVDVSNPAQPRHLTALVQAEGCHNKSFDPGTEQLYQTNLTGTTVFDLSGYDPSNPPTELQPYLALGGAHDIVAETGLVYTAHDDRTVYEATNRHDPIGTIPVPCSSVSGGFLHTVRPSQDHAFAVMTCEGVFIDPTNPNNRFQEGAYLYDLDFTANGVEFTRRDEFYLPLEVAGSAHKPKVMNRYAYIAFYEAGLQVLQIHDHTHSFRFAANFDTSEIEQDRLLAGAQDVYPHLGTDRILVADKETGLWILEHTTLEQFAAYMSVL